MSPEQAAGRTLLDHRTDIYSLGATLYELLTLRPALAGDDREQLLRQLVHGSAPRVRSLAPHVSCDLETIVAKAMSRRPEDRYDTAADLAQDLRRFLEQRPIRARRPSRIRNAVRWVERHRLSAALLGMVLLLLMGLAVAGPLVAWNYRRLATNERMARQTAESVRKELQQLLRTTLTTTVATLEDVPNVEPLQERMIRDTLRQYDRLLRITADDISVRLDVATAYAALGRAIEFRLGQSKSRPLIDRAISDLRQLDIERPKNIEIQYGLASATFVRGCLEWSPDSFREAAQLFEELARREPDVAEYHAHWGYSLAYVGHASLGRQPLKLARESAIRAVQIMRGRYQLEPANPDRQADLAFSLACLSKVFMFEGRVREAHDIMHEATELWDEFDGPFLERTRTRLGYGEVVMEAAKARYFMGYPEDATSQLRENTVVLSRIIQGFPFAEWAVQQAAQAHMLLGDCLFALDNFDQADTEYRTALELARHPAILQSNRSLALSIQLRRSQLLWRMGEHQVAGKVAELAIKQAQRLADAPHGALADLYSMVPDGRLQDSGLALEHARLALHPDDGRAFRRLGVANFRAGNWRQAIVALEQGIERLHGGDAFDAYFMAMACHKLGLSNSARIWMKRARRKTGEASCTLLHEVASAAREAEQLLSEE